MEAAKKSKKSPNSRATGNGELQLTVSVGGEESDKHTRQFLDYATKDVAGVRSKKLPRTAPPDKRGEPQSVLVLVGLYIAYKLGDAVVDALAEKLVDLILGF